MGLNNYKLVIPGKVITDDDVNQFVRGLLGNVVPRNDSGIVAAYAGHLGTQEYPWETVFANRIVATNFSLTSNNALPANPQVGDQFILTGSPPRLYVCLVAGNWTQISTV